MTKTLIKLSDEFAQPMLEQIKYLSLPLFVQCGVQIDGTHFEFANGQVTLYWAENAPTEWAPLSEILLKFVQYVENTESAQ